MTKTHLRLMGTKIPKSKNRNLKKFTYMSNSPTVTLSTSYSLILMNPSLQLERNLLWSTVSGVCPVQYGNMSMLWISSMCASVFYFMISLICLVTTSVRGQLTCGTVGCCCFMGPTSDGDERLSEATVVFDLKATSAGQTLGLHLNGLKSQN